MVENADHWKDTDEFKQIQTLSQDMATLKASLAQQTRDTDFSNQGNMLDVQETYPVLPQDDATMETPPSLQLEMGDVIAIQLVDTQNFLYFTPASKKTLPHSHFTFKAFDTPPKLNARCQFVVDIQGEGLRLKSAMFDKWIQLLVDFDVYDQGYMVTTTEDMSDATPFTLQMEGGNTVRLLSNRGHVLCCASVLGGEYSVLATCPVSVESDALFAVDKV
jgi:hypothetical protein